jgi:hypothetical protein
MVGLLVNNELEMMWKETVSIMVSGIARKAQKYYGGPRDNCSLVLNLNSKRPEYELRRLPLVLYVLDRPSRQMGKTFCIKFAHIHEAISSSHESVEGYMTKCLTTLWRYQ